jgi:putative copper export protein
MTLRAVILWVHVLCGVVWVGACATFIIALAALAGEPNELYAIAIRIAPQLNRLCVPLAIAIPITGVGNLLFVVQARRTVLPPEFVEIVAAKIGLLAVMGLALVAAWAAAPKLDERPPIRASGSSSEVNVRRIVASYGLIVGAGIVALGLGLWLSGT